MAALIHLPGVSVRKREVSKETSHARSRSPPPMAREEMGNSHAFSRSLTLLNAGRRTHGGLLAEGKA
jgi:hypothetical protein